MKRIEKQDNSKVILPVCAKPFLSQPQDVEQDTFVFCPNAPEAKQCKKDLV